MVRWTALDCQGTLLALAAAATFLGCGGRTADVAAPGPEQVGTVRRVGTFGFAIVPDRDPGTRYAPDRLPAAFQVDGLRVAFRGTEASAPPGTRLWGTPFRLSSIRRE